MTGPRSANPGMVWFRRDLRLDDNPAWNAATARHGSVVALFVLEVDLLASVGAPRRDQYLAHLHALDADLKERGGKLVVIDGPAASAIPRFVAEHAGAALYFNRDVSAFAAARDREVEAALKVPVHTFDGLLVHAPGTVLTQKGTLSQVFTPFFKVWNNTPLATWPEPGDGQPLPLDGVALPTPAGPARQRPGAAGAWERLQAWLDQVDEYGERRDLPAEDGTSDLSADLRFGTLSPRTVLDVVGAQSPGRAAFLRQLAWRDWWAHTLVQHPDLGSLALRDQYRTIDWRNDRTEFDRWCRGQTGFPIVDAGMRQLAETGWMHNRVRMLTASFLVKDLLVDWRWGERFFRHHLIDGDPAQNAGNWQWVAGTGPDAAPYFRVFNPTTQGLKFDPKGEYVRQWVPELRPLVGKLIHEPTKASAAQLRAAGLELGRDYPTPMVDHAAARERALSTYKATSTPSTDTN